MRRSQHVAAAVVEAVAIGHREEMAPPLPRVCHSSGRAHAIHDALRGGEGVGGRVNQVTLYRLVRAEGRLALFSADLREALCIVLDVSPGDLFQFEPEQPKRRKSA